MKKILPLLALFTILLIPVSFTTAYAASEPGQNTSEGRLSRSESAFRLLSELVNEQPGKNVIISPLSIDLALSMTYNGARGDTEKVMAQAMGIPGTTCAALNSTNQDLMKRLADKDRDIELTIASSIWTMPGVKFNKDFISQVAKYYSADVKTILDAAEINGWVVKKTKGRIKKIIETISAESVMVILNAVYFQGTWTTPFSKNKTTAQPFHLNDEDTVSVPLMRRENVNSYAKFDDFQSVYLTYGNARAYRMYIFCPEKVTGLPGFLARLNDKSWNTFISGFPKPVVIKNKEQLTKCVLVLPKFAAEYENEMSAALSKMGMENAFSAEKADFSGISAEKLYIEKIQHKCCVEVSEEGTEATAATAAMMARDMPPTVIVNRPFFFAITHNTTGTILFMGAIYNPQNKVKR
ncbi:MAG: serpin family protein [Candidatus Xenobiia bacterium LiM19]